VERCCEGRVDDDGGSDDGDGAGAGAGWVGLLQTIVGVSIGLLVFGKGWMATEHRDGMLQVVKLSAKGTVRCWITGGVGRMGERSTTGRGGGRRERYCVCSNSYQPNSARGRKGILVLLL
jgi:hypothetical protein